MQITLANATDALLYPLLFTIGYVTTCLILSHNQSALSRLYILHPSYKSLLRSITIVHNAVLIVYSGVTCILMSDAFLQGIPDPTFAMNLCWVFTYSKIYEFLDTYLILLKGQPTIFLQKYHHIGALICWWLNCYYLAPDIYMPTLLNSFIHTIMYSYYLAAILGYKWTTVKPFITVAQLSQFFIGSYIAISTSLLPAFQTKSFNELLVDGPFVVGSLMIVYTTGLVYLFLQFFLKEYCFRH